VIRRAIWLTIGAVLGIAGYRRLAGAAKSIRGPVDQRAVGQRSSARAFVRDVRVGTAQYLDRHRGYIDRHPGSLGNTLEGQQDAHRPAEFA